MNYSILFQSQNDVKVGLNPVSDIKMQTEWTIEFLQQGANHTLNKPLSQLAVSQVLSIPDDTNITILTLVDLWEKDARLQEFAQAIRKAFLPN